MPISSTNDFIASLKTRQRVIKTIAGTLVIAQQWSTFYAPGIPLPASVQAVNTAVAYGGQSVGGVVVNAPAGGNIFYLGQCVMRCNNASVAGPIGDLDIYDRLTSQAMPAVGIATANPLPAIALPRYTTGDFLECFLEVQATPPTGTVTLTINYTNEAGVTGRTAALSVPLLTSTPIGTLFRFLLASGDRGIQSIQNVASSGAVVSGRFSLVLARYLATIPMALANISDPQDFAELALPPITGNPCAMLVLTPAAVVAANSVMVGQLTFNEFAP